ncbi:MAG: ABC transporter substrate-binding protein [Chloroflexi bacterium]|nr:ABC transporter substrate-binding protein [Chloroflexota bacterium]
MKGFRLILVALVAVLALALATGCGGDDDGGGGGGSGTPIKLGFSAWPGWFPWQVAEEAGIFKKAGVNVDLVWFDGYLDSINALAAGKLDANSQTLNDTIGSVAAGSDQVIVLTNDNSTGNDQVIASKEIQSVQDLKGKKIGLEAGVVDNYLLLLGLTKAGLKTSDVQIVNLETGAAASAFAAGQLDAVAVFAPFTTQALKREGSKTLFSSKDFPGAIPDHLAVSKKLVTDRPGDVQKLVNAWFMTVDYIKANPDKATKIMAKRAGVSEEEYKSYDAGTTIFSVDDNVKAFAPGTDLKSLQFAAADISKFMLEAKLIDKEAPLGGLFDSTFITAYAQKK